MAILIRNAKLAHDSWQRLEPAGGRIPPAIPERGDLLVSLQQWQSSAGALLGRPSGGVGVWLAPEEDPALIADSLDVLALVAVFFPQFADGRGYSTARLLRERYGWTGELRAIGDVQRDQLFYLSRVGFDTFELNDGIDAAAALSAFGDFSDAYQASVERPLPLFRRRAAEPA